MILSQEFLKYRLDKFINDSTYRNMKQDEAEKYLMYNGQIRQLLMEAIKKEFKKPETVNELQARLLPINIYRKVINRLAQVYLEQPVRAPRDGNEADDELLGQYEDFLRMNVTGKRANREFKSYKKCLMEPYLDDKGFPRIRVVPSHTCYTFSSSPVTPDVPDEVWKVIKISKDPKDSLYSVWTDSQFVVCNGAGEIDRVRMAGLNNPEGINVYGVLPFAYITEGELSTEPIPDDDLKAISLAMPIVLSDLAIGAKYQAWSMIWTVGLGQQDLPSGPNTAVHLDYGPEGQTPSINQVKPQLDVDGVLRLIEATMSYLLSTRGLQTGAISGILTAGNAESGVAKMIDGAELSEDRKEQQSYFVDLETQVWNKLSANMIPHWYKTGQLNQDVRKLFSSKFSANVQLSEPKVMLSDRERIEISKMRLDAGLTTLKRELAIQYPEMTAREIEVLEAEILMERNSGFSRVSGEMTEDGTEGQV